MYTSVLRTNRASKSPMAKSGGFSRKAKAKMTQMMNEGMIMPYAKALKDAGIEVEITAPTPEAPSVAQALLIYLEKNK